MTGPISSHVVSTAAGKQIRTPQIPLRDLKRGMQGPAVRTLQAALVRLGYLSAAQAKTGPGVFGPRTEAAVKRFQRRHGVASTGYYGPRTRAALLRRHAKSAAPKPPEKPNPTTGTGSKTNTAAWKKPPVINAPSPNFNSRGGKDIDSIVLHHTASNNGKGDLAYMRKASSQVSAHYMLERDGKIYQLVGDTKRAWHAGTSALRGVPTDMNARSIGIEIVNDGSGKTPFTAAQYKSLGKLVGFLRRKYKVPMKNIVGHKDIAIPKGRKTDPAPNFSWKRLRASI